MQVNLRYALIFNKTLIATFDVYIVVIQYVLLIIPKTKQYINN